MKHCDEGVDGTNAVRISTSPTFSIGKSLLRVDDCNVTSPLLSRS